MTTDHALEQSIARALGTRRLPPRPTNGHKGTFGSVLVIGGCAAGATRMLGAPVLATRAALRTGVGLARLMAPQPIVMPALALVPGATGLVLGVDGRGEVIGHEAVALVDEHAGEVDAIVVGPGLGDLLSIEPLVLRVLQQTRVPVVVDADALNAMGRIPELARDLRASCILTPHPGEYRRLAESLKIEADPISPAQRPTAAQLLAQRLGCVVVLKGAGTVVSNGQETWTCGHGHPCMATGGTGDVLAGVLGGILAQYRAIERARPRGSKHAGVGIAAPLPHASSHQVPAKNSSFDEAPGLARVMSTSELMALAAAKMGKRAPDATGSSPGSASNPQSASELTPLTLMDQAILGVLAHALAGEAWAKAVGGTVARRGVNVAGMMPEELVDQLPGVLAAMRAG